MNKLISVVRECEPGRQLTLLATLAEAMLPTALPGSALTLVAWLAGRWNRPLLVVAVAGAVYEGTIVGGDGFSCSWCGSPGGGAGCRPTPCVGIGTAASGCSIATCPYTIGLVPTYIMLGMYDTATHNTVVISAQKYTHKFEHVSF